MLLIAVAIFVEFVRWADGRLSSTTHQHPLEKSRCVEFCLRQPIEWIHNRMPKDSKGIGMQLSWNRLKCYRGMRDDGLLSLFVPLGGFFDVEVYKCMGVCVCVCICVDIFGWKSGFTLHSLRPLLQLVQLLSSSKTAESTSNSFAYNIRNILQECPYHCYSPLLFSSFSIEEGHKDT